jgi:tRNA(Arg) A34 adenosine deaminase TadA
MDDTALIRRTLEIARRAVLHGNHPFGALLVDGTGLIVLESENTVETLRDPTGHAETNLVRAAGAKFSRIELAEMTLYTSTEPCAMCSGAIYWAGIGSVVYGLSEAGLLALTGNNPTNETMHLPCREVLARGQRTVQVRGPLLEDEAVLVHKGFWDWSERVLKIIGATRKVSTNTRPSSSRSSVPAVRGSEALYGGCNTKGPWVVVCHAISPVNFFKVSGIGRGGKGWFVGTKRWEYGIGTVPVTPYSGSPLDGNTALPERLYWLSES